MINALWDICFVIMKKKIGYIRRSCCVKPKYAIVLVLSLISSWLFCSFGICEEALLNKLPVNFFSDNPQWGNLEKKLDSPYINPTEHNPAAASFILDSAPSGLYFTVGSERAFIGAAQTHNVTHLLIVDIQQNLLNFNLLNIALLQVAESRLDYLWLRLSASPAELVKRFEKIDIGARTYLYNEHNWEWWQKIREQAGFILLEAKPANFDHAFHGANYLYDDIQFNRISKMAKLGNIACVLADLGDEAQVKDIANKLRDLRISLAVLDISDLWYDIRERSFLKVGQSVNLIQNLKPIALNNSILLLTSWFGKFQRPYNVERKPKILKNGTDARSDLYEKTGLSSVPYWKWIYFGFRFNMISNINDSSYLFKELNMEFNESYQANPALAGTLDGVSVGQIASRKQALQAYTIKDIFSKLKSQDTGLKNLALKSATYLFKTVKSFGSKKSTSPHKNLIYCDEILN